ncbi:limbic system-associated membrane protein-like [Maniola hyperantus]|uniref:limbic system-associated membrane protein-like n=1 Tax=Aphantopus hyperantus TaxID=2795564 RepID=UPI00156807AC|nr:neural cell adhesion molecule 1-like [Maniola hyperantus]
MKWIFYVLVFIYMFYRTVYGKILPTVHKETQSISIDPIVYGLNDNFFRVGERITLVCKGGSKSQKVEWVNPEGEIVQREVRNRVYAQEHFVASHKGRMPALLLILSHATVEDTGVWQCRTGASEYLINSGDTVRQVSLCIIDPASFVDTLTEVTVDHGRSITLSCQARGEPEPRLVWYRYGQIITDDPSSSKYGLMTQYHSQGFTGLLTILSAESDDSGEYNCEAIQESSRSEECSAKIITNITLHVNSPPEFLGGNETALVAAQENKSVDLVCAADAYPTPTYRWFKEVGDILSEYPKDVIELQNDGQEAVITIIANSSAFGHKYRCRATNEYGDVDKVFSLISLEPPRKPDEITLQHSNHEQLQFYARWKGDVFFPVDDMIVQYLKKDSLRKKSMPREIDWKKAVENEVKTEAYDLINEEKSGLVILLLDMEEETDYWVRMRAVNDAGTSPWSKPISASTTAKSEEDIEETPEEEVDEDEKPKASALSDSTFYGVFFAGGIVVIAVGCMLIMRMV